MMKIAIAGGSGFVGQAITQLLLAEQHDIYILTRHIAKQSPHEQLTYVQWLNELDQPEKMLEQTDVFINLAGESLNSGRWTAQRKKDILNSRLAATKEINRIISVLKKKPHTLLNASAVGYYGTSITGTFTEQDYPAHQDFLSETVTRWEQEAEKANQYGVRTVLMRFGVILGKEAGALPRMTLPYKLFVGGTIGNGKQWLSWIHIDDVVKATLYCLHTKTIQGPVNFTAPEPETMKSFGKCISTVMKRPHYFPVPSPLLQLLLGEMSILVLEGQKVLPKQLEQHGYTFSFPDLVGALHDLFH